MSQLSHIINNQSNIRIFITLFVSYFVLCLIHISEYSSNADVLVYSCRALNDTPILHYAFLDYRSLTLHNLVPSPNYHIAHTVLLWVTYNILPSTVSASIYPSGALSALFGSLAVGLSFIVCIQLKLDKYTAFLISIAAGFIPSIFYHSTIGEVYALGLFSTLLFIYLFQSGKIILSSLAFLFTNLVSPTYGPTFSFYFLQKRDIKTLTKSIIIGATSLILYFIIHNYLVGSDIFRLIDSDRDYMSANYDIRTMMLYVCKFSFLLILNIGIFVPYLVYGTSIMWKEHRGLLTNISMVALVLTIITFPRLEFTVELGSFFLPLFWVLCIPIGIGMARTKKPAYLLFLAILGMYGMTHLIWMKPNSDVGSARYDAGVILGEKIKDNVKILGHWTPSIGVVIGKYGWDYEKLAANYIEYEDPQDHDLIKTGENNLLIIERKGPEWRRKYKEILEAFQLRVKTGENIKNITIGNIEKIYENEEFYIYKWHKQN